MHLVAQRPEVRSRLAALGFLAAIAAAGGCQALLVRADHPTAAKPGAEAAAYAWREGHADPAVRLVGAEDELKDPLFARRLRRANLLAQDDELKKAPGGKAPAIAAPEPAPAPKAAVPPPMPKTAPALVPPMPMGKTMEPPPAAPMPPNGSAGKKPGEDLKPVPRLGKEDGPPPPPPPPPFTGPFAPPTPVGAPPIVHQAEPIPAPPPIPLAAPGVMQQGTIVHEGMPMPGMVVEGGMPMPGTVVHHDGMALPGMAQGGACPIPMAGGACPAPMMVSGPVEFGLGMPRACNKGVSADQPGLLDNVSARLGGSANYADDTPSRTGAVGALESSMQLGGRPWFGYAGLAAEYHERQHWPLSFSTGFSKLARIQGCSVVDPWIFALHYDGYFDSKFLGRNDSAYLDQARGLLGYAVRPGLDVGVWGTASLRGANFESTVATPIANGTRFTTTRINDRLANRAAGYVSLDIGNRGAQVVASAGWQESVGDQVFAEFDTVMPVARNVNLWAGGGYGSAGRFDAAAGIELLYGQATLQARGRNQCADACANPCGDPCGERYRGGWANGNTRSALRVWTPARMRRSLGDQKIQVGIRDVLTPAVLPAPVEPGPGPGVQPPLADCPPRLTGHTVRPRNPKLGAECPPDAAAAGTSGSSAGSGTSSQAASAECPACDPNTANATLDAWLKANAK